MFILDTFLNVKRSCILVIRVVFKVQLKDLMTANTKKEKNILKTKYDNALQLYRNCAMHLQRNSSPPP